jgi:hypothetical protein
VNKASDIRCYKEKKGKFARLRCIREYCHRGDCNYVVVGVLPVLPGQRRAGNPRTARLEDQKT